MGWGFGWKKSNVAIDEAQNFFTSQKIIISRVPHALIKKSLDQAIIKSFKNYIKIYKNFQ